LVPSSRFSRCEWLFLLVITYHVLHYLYYIGTNSDSWVNTNFIEKHKKFFFSIIWSHYKTKFLKANYIFLSLLLLSFYFFVWQHKFWISYSKAEYISKNCNVWKSNFERLVNYIYVLGSNQNSKYALKKNYRKRFFIIVLITSE